jgi:hypothetical protein
MLSVNTSILARSRYTGRWMGRLWAWYAMEEQRSKVLSLFEYIARLCYGTMEPLHLKNNSKQLDALHLVNYP